MDEEMSEDAVDAARMQIEITFAIMREIKERKRFTARDILTTLAVLGIHPMIAQAFFANTLASMVGKTVRQEGDYFIYEEEKSKTIEDHMSGFRAMLDTKNGNEKP